MFGCGTLRTAEFEQFVYGEMVKKLSEFQTLTAKATTVNPKLTALNVELAQVEDEIEKLLNTLTGANAVLLSYANGKIEELDASRQRLIKEIAALNAETISPQKIEFLSAHLENWNTIDFDDRRRVTDIISGKTLGGVVRVHLADTAFHRRVRDIGRSGLTCVGECDRHRIVTIAGQSDILRSSVVDLIPRWSFSFRDRIGVCG